MARVLRILVLLSAAFAGPAPAWSVEYRLLVANLHDQSYFYYLGWNGAEPRLDRLEAALDAGVVPPGSFIPDRDVQPLPRTLAPAFGSTVVTPKAPSPNGGQWIEVHWEGAPGARTVWVISGSGTHFQEVTGVGLRTASGSLRHYYLYRASGSLRDPLRALLFPLMLIHAAERDTGFWPRWLEPRVDLRDGLAVIVGENPNLAYPDPVYVVIENAVEPTTYKLSLAWRYRPGVRLQQFEGAGGGSDPTSR
jgi:hypothetical protein